jgi:hypothetical protein
MLFSRPPKRDPPRWVADAGESVYQGILVFCVVTLLFGLAILLFA